MLRPGTEKQKTNSSGLDKMHEAGKEVKMEGEEWITEEEFIGIVKRPAAGESISTLSVRQR